MINMTNEDPTSYKIIFVMVSYLFLTFIIAMGFTPPTTKDCLNAIGSTDDLPLTLKRAFTPKDDFEHLHPPKRGDWLAEHFEPGQRFEEFVNSVAVRVKKDHYKICLQPLGEFRAGYAPSLKSLKRFTEAYFMMKVRIMPPIPLKDKAITTRQNPYTGKSQIFTGDILGLLKKIRPSDTFCIMGITMEDLYPHPSWNFVFGQASVVDGIGIFSFARYDPLFYGEEREEDFQTLLLHRSCKVLAHETGHMFSLAHCIYFRCVMNGSNHLKESDERPIHLCPVCLRKLHYSIGFDVVERYRRLLDFYRSAGFLSEVKWVQNRLNWIVK